MEDISMSKIRNTLIILLAVTLLLPACSGLATSIPNTPEEDFAIYSAAFKFEFKVSSLDGLVITQPSHNFGGEGQEEYLNTQFKNLASPDLKADFIAQNQAGQPLDAIFAGHPEITLLGQDELSQIFDPALSRDGWKEFYARYPHAGGTITVSMIGYDRSHTHALLLVGMQSAPLAGYGEYLLLEKANGAWQVVKNVMAWIS